MYWVILIAIVLTVLVAVVALNIDVKKSFSVLSVIILIVGFGLLWLEVSTTANAIQSKRSLSETVGAVSNSILQVVGEENADYRFDYNAATNIFLTLKLYSPVSLEGMEVNDIVGQTVVSLPQVIGKELAQKYKTRIVVNIFLILLTLCAMCFFVAKTMQGTSRGRSSRSYSDEGYSKNTRFEDF